MIITVEQLARSTGAPLARASRFLPFVNNACASYDINTPLRAAQFLAQVGEESGSLYYVSEIWGPSAAQLSYERNFTKAWGPIGPNRKAFELGNERQGDGRKFKGHGLLQITGRANHAKVRDRLRSRLGGAVPDFETTPEALELPQWAATSAADYWGQHGLNSYADVEDFETITRKINGGLTHFDHRQALLASAKIAFGIHS
jgi:putative chitinase